MRETSAAVLRFTLKDAKPSPEFLPNEAVLGLMDAVGEIANPTFLARAMDDAVVIRMGNAPRTSERAAAIRAVLAARKDLVIAETPDRSLAIRLVPGVHLFTRKSPVDDAQLTAQIQSRAAALKLGSVTVAPAGNARATVAFASGRDRTRFREAITRGQHLVFRLVDEAASDGKTAPETDSEKLPMLEGLKQDEFLWLRPGAILTGDAIATAYAETSKQTGQIVLMVRLTEEGSALFGAATRANIGRRIAVVVDGVVLTAPMVREPILGGSLQIEGNFTLESAKALAARIVPEQIGVPLRLVDTGR